MLNFLQHKYALSEKGAKDMCKAFAACTVSYLVQMLPVMMLMFLVRGSADTSDAGRQRRLLCRWNHHLSGFDFLRDCNSVQCDVFCHI